MLSQEAPGYLVTYHFPGEQPGSLVRGFRNEDLEAQTFPDETFDIVLTQDVLEHLFHPDRAIREIYRTLKPGGMHLCTFPVSGRQHEAAKPRAVREAGEIKHLTDAIYHGSPVSRDGSLVTFDYGYEIHKLIAEWAPFDVTVSRFSQPSAGILGDFTEVIVCEKPA